MMQSNNAIAKAQHFLDDTTQATWPGVADARPDGHLLSWSRQSALCPDS